MRGLEEVEGCTAEAADEPSEAHITRWIFHSRISACNTWDLVLSEDYRNMIAYNDGIIATLRERLSLFEERQALAPTERDTVRTLGLSPPPT